jgi:hypothetical protein
MKNMKAIFVLAPAIILQGVVRIIAASQQRSDTTLDQQEHCDLQDYSSYSRGFVVGQHNTEPNSSYYAPVTTAILLRQQESYCLGFQKTQLHAVASLPWI